MVEQLKDMVSSWKTNLPAVLSVGSLDGSPKCFSKESVLERKGAAAGRLEIGLAFLHIPQTQKGAHLS